tara:strand:+ start:2199 stop:2474 length:276 start_codon:yes stop_codon:yes gene_type:complete
MSKKKTEFVLKKLQGIANSFDSVDKEGVKRRYFSGEYNADGTLHKVFGTIKPGKDGQLKIWFVTQDAVEAEIEEGERRAEKARNRATKIEQ